MSLFSIARVTRALVSHQKARENPTGPFFIASWFERPRKRGPVITGSIVVERVVYAKLIVTRVHLIARE